MEKGDALVGHGLDEGAEALPKILGLPSPWAPQSKGLKDLKKGPVALHEGIDSVIDGDPVDGVELRDGEVKAPCHQEDLKDLLLKPKGEVCRGWGGRLQEGEGGPGPGGFILVGL